MTETLPPETRYARSGDVNIAYQSFGEGEITLVFCAGFFSHVEVGWENPEFHQYFKALSRFCRVLIFDKRGVGMSDRVSTDTTLEERMDDIRAVMDAESVERAAMLGISEGGAMAMLFAVRFPERVSHLIVYGAFPRWMASGNIPGTFRNDESREKIVGLMDEHWGTGAMLHVVSPDMAKSADNIAWWARYERLSASPGSLRDLMRMNANIELDDLLPEISVPTLVLHRTGDRLSHISNGRYLGEHIPGAKYIELSGTNHILMGKGAEETLEEIEEFLTGERHKIVTERLVATVLFADIVDSTSIAAAMGNEAWGRKLAEFQKRVRGMVKRYHGEEIDTAGDGYFASFNSPTSAIQCAQAIQPQIDDMGLKLRCGLHTGECERIGNKVGGIAVHIGARVAGYAEAGDILLTSTVKDMLIGSAIEFEERGRHELKGVPGEWVLYAVSASGN